jgi:hypothetical protein
VPLHRIHADVPGDQSGDTGGAEGYKDRVIW